MNNPELYKRTVDILFAAYFNDTLSHGQCTACAVGNLIAAGKGYKMLGKSWFDGGFRVEPLWTCVFSWGSPNHGSAGMKGETKEQIDSTGYSWKDLMKIEGAFEKSNPAKHELEISNEEAMFNGLVAVLEVLKEIHQVEEGEAEESKQRFSQHFHTLKTA